MSADILRIFVILLGIALVAVILIQQPKDGGISAFTGGGGGASGTVFGAKGSGSFLFKLTAVLILLFAIMVAVLVKITNSDLGGSVLSAPVAEESAIPGQVPTPENISNQTDSNIPGQAQTPADAANKTDSDIPGQAQTPADAANKTDSDIPGQAQTPINAANKTDSDIPGQVETPAVSNDKPSTTVEKETIPKAATETPAPKKETDATPGN